jgi:hypothetical protein
MLRTAQSKGDVKVRVSACIGEKVLKPLGIATYGKYEYTLVSGGERMCSVATSSSSIKRATAITTQLEDFHFFLNTNLNLATFLSCPLLGDTRTLILFGEFKNRVQPRFCYS